MMQLTKQLCTYVMRSASLILRMGENFYQTSGGIRAASLAYTLLLSFVPFTISMINITNWLPFSAKLTKAVEDSILVTFLPHLGGEIYHHLSIFMQHSQRLTIVGLVFLLITTYMMLFSIEKHINELWQSKQPHNWLHSIFINTLFITISPIIICSIMYLRMDTRGLVHSASVNALIDAVLTTLVTIGTFIAVYKFIPNRKVAWNHALVAGIIAGILFEFSKKIFLFLCSNVFLNYNILYGSLAFFPLFLIWIYICSFNLLFCAEIIYVLESRQAAPLKKRLPQ